jgi:prepilin-type N-terminal cleavage/methylation domain-containing protein
MIEPQENKRIKRGDVLTSRGFTLIEVLTVAAMIGILATTAVASTRGSKRIAFETRAVAAMKNIAENEAIYYNRFRVFGTWDQMKNEGDLVDPGYEEVDDLSSATDMPIAYLYSIVIRVSPGGQCFTVAAYPSEAALWRMRTYATTCDGGILNSKDQGRFLSTVIMP